MVSIATELRGNARGQKWALKVLKPFYGKEKETKELLAREISILTQLSAGNGAHPNIAKLADVLFERKNGTLRASALVLEYGDCGDLYSYLSCSTGRPLAVEFIQAVFQQVARGVKHLHSLNIVHSDLKPENILLKSNGHVLITDFGFAQVVSPNYEITADDSSESVASINREIFHEHSDLEPSLAQSPLLRSKTLNSLPEVKIQIPTSKSTNSLGKLAYSRRNSSSSQSSRLLINGFGGTVEYKAPESFPPYNSSDCFDGAAADMWSLGVVLHVMLYGRLPQKDEYSQKRREARRKLKHNDTWGHSMSFSEAPGSPKRPRSFTGNASISSLCQVSPIACSRERAGKVVERLMVKNPLKRLTAYQLAVDSWVDCGCIQGSVNVVSRELKSMAFYRCR